MDVLRWMAESYTSGVVRDFFVFWKMVGKNPFWSSAWGRVHPGLFNAFELLKRETLVSAFWRFVSQAQKSSYLMLVFLLFLFFWVQKMGSLICLAKDTAGVSSTYVLVVYQHLFPYHRGLSFPGFSSVLQGSFSQMLC